MANSQYMVQLIQCFLTVLTQSHGLASVGK